MEIRYDFLLMTWRRLKRQCSSVPSSISAPFMLQFLPSVLTLRSVVPLSYEKDQAGLWSTRSLFNVLKELKLNEGAKNISYS